MVNQSTRKPKLPQSEIKSAFAGATLELGIEQILLVKNMNPAFRKSTKYAQILSSIREVGIIEPLVVYPGPKSSGQYILLDGHLRLEALKDLKEKKVICLISHDDEGFTYNKHTNRLSIIQEHKMILEAIKRGVTEEQIARTFNIDVKRVTEKRNLLNGICPEAAEMLKDKMIAVASFPMLKRMKPLRQIEAATLMNDAQNYSSTYVRALLAATPKSQLVDPENPKKINGIDEEKMARMESEMEGLQREYKLIEENYGEDVLNLTLAKGYIGNLITNTRIARYLTQHHPEFMTQFQKDRGDQFIGPAGRINF